MAFSFIVDCSGEDHELTYDRGRLHVDPAHHDVALERTFVDLGATATGCLRFADAADTKTDISTTEFSTHLEWLLWEVLSGGMLDDYDFDLLTIDFVRRVLPSLAPMNVSFDGLPSSQLAAFMKRVVHGRETEQRLKGVRNTLDGWADKTEYDANLLLGMAAEAERSGKHAKADRLVEKSKAMRSAEFAARACAAALWVAHRSRVSRPDISYIEDAARFARLSKGEAATEENFDLTLGFEERWQIQHTLKAVASVQKGKPWPSV